MVGSSSSSDSSPDEEDEQLLLLLLQLPLLLSVNSISESLRERGVSGRMEPKVSSRVRVTIAVDVWWLLSIETAESVGLVDSRSIDGCSFLKRCSSAGQWPAHIQSCLITSQVVSVVATEEIPPIGWVWPYKSSKSHSLPLSQQPAKSPSPPRMSPRPKSRSSSEEAEELGESICCWLTSTKWASSWDGETGGVGIVQLLPPLDDELKSGS